MFDIVVCTEDLTIVLAGLQHVPRWTVAQSSARYLQYNIFSVLQRCVTRSSPYELGSDAAEAEATDLNSMKQLDGLCL